MPFCDHLAGSERFAWMIFCLPSCSGSFMDDVVAFEVLRQLHDFLSSRASRHRFAASTLKPSPQGLPAVAVGLLLLFGIRWTSPPTGS
jgi:hypothetical protein